MKMGTLIAWSVPEFRKLSGAQLLEVWDGCTEYSRLKIYLHIILLLVCCSAIFNLAMWVNVHFLVDVLGLALGITVPPNIYFYNVFTPRRSAVRKFIEEHREAFGG